MADQVVENLILDLLEWLRLRDRSYEEVIDAWRTSCPKLPVWEDANDRGLVAFDIVQRNIVRVTGIISGTEAEGGIARAVTTDKNASYAD
jgi:hypothetical protein